MSPLLFLIFINDIDVDLDANTTASLFADDTAPWMNDGKIRGSNRTLMPNEIDKILSWAKKWKMSVNESKTKSMVISSSNGDRSWDPMFTAGTKQVETVKEYKFLGVAFDSRLTLPRFRRHLGNG